MNYVKQIILVPTVMENRPINKIIPLTTSNQSSGIIQKISMGQGISRETSQNFFGKILINLRSHSKYQSQAAEQVQAVPADQHLQL